MPEGFDLMTKQGRQQGGHCQKGGCNDYHEAGDEGGIPLELVPGIRVGRLAPVSRV